MSKTLMVQTKETTYPIKFTQSFKEISSLLEPISLKDRKVCIVTDDQVGSIYLEEVMNAIDPLAKQAISFVFKAGEENKTLSTVYELYEVLIEEQFDRHSLLIALGGGVVGDLTGFTASTFLRGIDFIQCPTSLLAQVDSSIGGKTGVDFKGYKNMVGAFYQPKLVIMNTMALSTLSKKDFNSGMAEIIKHAIIQDVSYLSWLESSFEKIQSMDANTLKEMIYRSCCIKKEVVEQDEKEQSIRALLNFGHTVGHAIEKLMDFELFHGECVALGMIVAGFISFKRGYITVKEFNRIEKIIEDFNLPSKITGLSIDEIIEVTKSDKKVKGSVLHFVLIKALGEASIYTDISNEELSEAIHYIMN